MYIGNAIAITTKPSEHYPKGFFICSYTSNELYKSKKSLKEDLSNFIEMEVECFPIEKVEYKVIFNIEELNLGAVY